MAASQRTNPATVSPKVKAAGWTGLALTLLGALITGITPDMLDFLGEWKSLAFSVLTAVGMLVAAYKKNDPARWDLSLNQPEQPAAQTFDPSPVVIPEPAPAANEVLGIYPDEDDDVPGRHEATPAG